MFIKVTLSAAFLATTQELARELPELHIDTSRVQLLELRDSVTQAEALHLMESYEAAIGNRYDSVELIEG